MQAQGSVWSARERTVIAMMENYLDKSDDLRVEVRELEVLMSPEDSEVNMMCILTQASRRGSRIFEIFSTCRRSDHFVASRNRWVNFQKKKVEQQERLQRSAKKDCDQGDPCWTEACEGIARKMLKYL